MRQRHPHARYNDCSTARTTARTRKGLTGGWWYAGAEPLFFLDYFATGALAVDEATQVVKVTHARTTPRHRTHGAHNTTRTARHGMT